MEVVIEERQKESRVYSALLFAMHQTISTWIVLSASPIVFAILSDFARLLGQTRFWQGYNWILTQTPYFPVQISLALFLGWSLSGFLRHRSMLWVWIIPFLILCFALAVFSSTGQILIANYSHLSSPNILPHFFGWGCQPKNHCLDQLLITMPFYSASSYSLVAMLARKLGNLSYYAEIMNRMDVPRAFMFVGGSYVCLEFLLGWRFIFANAFFRTWLGAGFFLYGVFLRALC